MEDTNASTLKVKENEHHQHRHPMDNAMARGLITPVAASSIHHHENSSTTPVAVSGPRR